jgi:hypothetical protein
MIPVRITHGILLNPPREPDSPTTQAIINCVKAKYGSNGFAMPPTKNQSTPTAAPTRQPQSIVKSTVLMESRNIGSFKAEMVKPIARLIAMPIGMIAKRRTRLSVDCLFIGVSLRSAIFPANSHHAFYLGLQNAPPQWGIG